MVQYEKYSKSNKAQGSKIIKVIVISMVTHLLENLSVLIMKK